MMDAKGCKLGQPCCQIPNHSSSNVPVLPLLGGFDSSLLGVKNKAGFFTGWGEHPKIARLRDLIRRKIVAIVSSSIYYEKVQQAADMATRLEQHLFITSASEEEYMMKHERLIQNLQTQLKLKGAKCCQQVEGSMISSSSLMPSFGLLDAWYDKSRAEPPSQKLADIGMNPADYCPVTMNDKYKYGFSKGEPSYPPFIHEKFFSPEEGSSISTCTDMDGLSNYGASGSVSNPETCFNFQPQHIDDRLPVEMNLTEHQSYFGTDQEIWCSPQSVSLNLLTPQCIPREISEVSSLSYNPGSVFQSSSLKDMWECTSQKLACQNFKHFNQPFYHHGNASMAHLCSRYDDQDEPLLGQNKRKQPQVPSRHLNGDQQYASVSSVFLCSSNGPASLNSCFSSQVSVEQKILLAYFRCKNASNFPGNGQISLIKYLHSMVCENGMCTCEQIQMLLVHFDECQIEDCYICSPLKRLCVINKKEPHLEFSNTTGMESTVRDYNRPLNDSEYMLPPTKRMKMEHLIGVSSINNVISDLCIPKVAQPSTSEGLSGLKEQSESPLSIYSGVTESNSEPFATAMLESTIISKINSSLVDEQTFKREKIPSEELEADHVLKESQPDNDDVIGCNLKEGGRRLNSSMNTLVVNHNVADSNTEPFALVMLESTSISKTNSSLVDEQTFKSDRMPFEELEADHIYLETHLDNHDVIGCNLKESGSRLSSSMNILLVDHNVTESNTEPFATAMLESTSINQTNSSLIDEQTFKSVSIPSEELEADHILEESHPDNLDLIGSNSRESGSRLNSNMNALLENHSVDMEDIQGGTESNHTRKGTLMKVVEPKADLVKGTKPSNRTNGVSLTKYFTRDQLREHIMSLQQMFDQDSSLFDQSISEKERGMGVTLCQLCAMDYHVFSPVPIYCLSCGTRIKRNANYYFRRVGETDTQYCFCTACYRNARGGSITFNGISVAKARLDRKRNDDGNEVEPWVQCDKCEKWQHQICGLFNQKTDLEGKAEYVCPICCLKEIESRVCLPLPETAIFGAEALPRTKLSDHIEQRLFKQLMQERADKAKVEGKNLEEVSGAENLAVRVVLSVDKQLKVNKQFLDIFCGESYPAEFPYRLKVILLFQKIKGVDVCLFGMYVQEFGSECGYPNQRSVYISYLDSVKYFRPQRQTVTGEALRTFVYHEILIGYLDFCKKRGFTTCYIWASPPLKGEDYVLYCHPETQKTPKSDKLRHWYQSMLKKASEQNIVVGHDNIYDHFFVPTGKCDSKVTAARLPYFDGDYWSGAAMDLVRNIENDGGGEYLKKMKKLMSKRTLKAMGHTNPSEGTTKDILVMQKLGQTILPVKEDFMIAHLQYTCTDCHQVILFGYRWFCNNCKKFQLCERCHTADTHNTISGEKHTLCQALVDDIPRHTIETDIILDNGLFENRYNFLSFCQKNRFQFDTLRRAKHSSMMILYHLRNTTMLSVETVCSFCCKVSPFQQSWQCEMCPQFTVCSECYKEKGAGSHVHKLAVSYSTASCQTGHHKLKGQSALTRELLEVLKHASQCNSTKSQPCSYPNCLQIKMLFTHASRCPLRASGGCQRCKKAWMILTLHSRNCQDSECRIPRCRDLKKHAEWIALQSESRRRAAVVESAWKKAAEVAC